MLGLAKTGGIASNGSGDYVIAVSTAKECRIPYRNKEPIQTAPSLRNEAMTPLFLAEVVKRWLIWSLLEYLWKLYQG